MKSVMIVTGEASGDLHGANLVRAMKKVQPEIQFSGMGGAELKAVGVNILCDAEKVSVVGIAEVFSHLSDIHSSLKLLKEHLISKNPDLLIIIDLPDFNLMLAKMAKSIGVPVFYYICPQVWAWRSGRVKTIAKRVDQVGVILPFEEKYLRDRGVLANYVGHPLLDSVQLEKTQEEFRKQYTIPEDALCVGLLPGSRLKEVSSLLPIFLEAAQTLQNSSERRMIFLVPRASTISEKQLFECGVDDYSEVIDVRVISDDRYSLMKTCDAVVAASGTVTLELALLDTPMVVCYKLSSLTYHLGKLLVKLKHFSLVNLIGEKEIVPELLQDQVSPENISNSLHRSLFDENYILEMKKGLALVREKMGSEGASDRAAVLALEMLQEKRV